MESLKNKLSIIIISVVFVPLLTNCTNGYIEFYKDFGVKDGRLNNNSNPEIYGTSSKNINEDIQKVRRNKYYTIGNSFFMGPSGSTNDITKAAKEKGADLVLYFEEYRDSTTSNTSMSVPDSQTSYHSGSVSSSGGYGTYSGTSTTYGTRQVPISITHHYYDFGAVFFRKYPNKPRIGFGSNSCTDQQKKQIQKNQCWYIQIIFNDSPAYRQNLMEGDIFISINGHDVYDQSTYDMAINMTKHQNIVNFKMMRNSKIIDIPIDVRK
ncbi:MAG: PDZ domain-containing protein [Lentimicrobiaceae bacterium]|nr:PDZ domain-containing protein [Lentimicrobiaceae bacterium]